MTYLISVIKKSFSRRRHLIRLTIVQIFFLISCSQKTENKNSEKKIIPQIQQAISVKETSLTKGIIHRKIFCRKDSSQSYAIYLPANYSSEKKFPVIYFFDSHADGLLPIEKYKLLAEKYGYIIACSNNSKNGLPWENTQQIIRNFFDDVQEIFFIDNRRIYTGGFSGGARVAGSIALTNDDIAGVVACGAGFPNSNEPVNKKFVFTAIAGNEDFNLIELKNLDRTLENSILEHNLIIFDGKHEWCPIEIMEEAFLNFEISAMKNKLAEKNDSLLNRYIGQKEKQIQQYKNKKQLIELWNLYRKLSVNLYGLADISKYHSELVAMENSPELISALKKEIDKETSEMNKQKEYSDSFASKDLSWWEAEIKSLQSKNSCEAKRILGYLGLAAYMYSNNALNKNQFPQAENFLKIYQLLEPENPEHQYLYAQLFMKTNEPEKAFSSLKAAVNIGFKDMARLKNDELLSALKNKQEYREIEKMLE